MVAERAVPAVHARDEATLSGSNKKNSAQNGQGRPAGRLKIGFYDSWETVGVSKRKSCPKPNQAFIHACYGMKASFHGSRRLLISFWTLPSREALRAGLESPPRVVSHWCSRRFRSACVVTVWCLARSGVRNLRTVVLCASLHTRTRSRGPRTRTRGRRTYTVTGSGLEAHEGFHWIQFSRKLISRICNPS